MTHCLCAVWLVLVASSAGAGVYIDKQLTTHCGALLLANERTAPTEFVERLRALNVGTHPDADYADVETLDLPGFDDAARIRRSDDRLAQLVRDLDRAPEVLSVTFVTRGPAVAAFLARLSQATETLDREVQRRTDALDIDLPRTLVESAAAATILAGGWRLAEGAPGPLTALVETAGLVGAAFVARGAIARAWGVWFPAHQLDLRRVRVDSHLRIVRDEVLRPRRGRGHIGQTAEVSTDLVNALLRARDVLDLDGAQWAGLLARHARDPRDARLLVDHVSFTEADEPVLLSAVRVVRGKPSARPTRADQAWTRPALGLAY